MAEFRKFLSNDVQGHKDFKQYFTIGQAGNITADTTHIVFVAPEAGRITNVVGSVQHNGVDATNALQMAFDVKKNGTSVASTVPVITKAATAGVNTTFTSGTGRTPAVIKTDGTQIVAAGDVITVVFDITRTASPSTEIQGPSVLVEFEPYAG